MSALIGVNNGHAVHILTDAATTRLNDGVVAEINCKQLRTRTGAVVAAMGFWEPVLRFTTLAEEHAQTFDEITAAAPELWTEARSIMSARTRNMLHAALLAGWNDANQRLEMHVLHSEVAEYDVFAAGPSDSEACYSCMNAFIERFRENPNAFDARRDGIGFMQEMRQGYPRKYESGPQAAVGGFVTHAVITRDGPEATVIHEWPDSVGELIDPANVGLSVTDRSFRLPRLLESLVTRGRIRALSDGSRQLILSLGGGPAAPDPSGPNSDRSDQSLPMMQAQRKTPNQQQVDWVKQDPARRAQLFDAEFGNGAWSSYQSNTPAMGGKSRA